MITIRTMTSEDVDCVSELDSIAFGAYWSGKNIGGAYKRTRENVGSSLRLNPAGCFVAADEKTVGYIFSRRWGKIGWIGTFGIHPDYRGRGIGKSLLEKALGVLVASGCRIIGLETMADSPYNIGLYLRSGFCAAYPTLNLCKRPSPSGEAASFVLLHQVGSGKALPYIRQLSEACFPGLDYAAEAKSAEEEGWGETLLIGWPKPWAFVIVRTVPGYQRAEPTADVAALVIHPENGRRLQDVLNAAEKFAYDRKVPQMNLSLNTGEGGPLKQVMGHGFRISRAMLRMVLNGIVMKTEGITLSRWAM